MKNKILMLIGLYLIADGIISVIVLGNWDYEIENIFRYIRAGIGAYLLWRFK